MYYVYHKALIGNKINNDDKNETNFKSLLMLHNLQTLFAVAVVVGAAAAAPVVVVF